MPLNTSSKRRSSVALWSPWQTAPPSPTDSPGAIDAGDREHTAWSYSGISAGLPAQITFLPVWQPLSMQNAWTAGRVM